MRPFLHSNSGRLVSLRRTYGSARQVRARATLKNRVALAGLTYWPRSGTRDRVVDKRAKR